MFSNLSKNILSTIVYYDILDYPMTSFEIWKYLMGDKKEGEKNSLTLVVKSLESDELKKYIAHRRGFYFLRGRESLVRKRIERNKISQTKFKKVIRLAKWLRCVPFVRMIAVTGRVAMKNAESGSDLDFLIVLKRGRIFTGRTLATLLVHLLGKRRYADKITDRACLNYFLTDDALEISSKDIYSSSEYSFIFPVFGQETFQKFQKENEWIRDFKPNWGIGEVGNGKYVGDSRVIGVIRGIFEKTFDWESLENFLRSWQMKRIENDPRTHQKGSAVMASDQALIFLPDPHGPKIYERFRERMEVLG